MASLIFLELHYTKAFNMTVYSNSNDDPSKTLKTKRTRNILESSSTESHKTVVY